MKFYFRLFVAGLLLLAGCSLALAGELNVDEFNSKWDNDPKNVYYSGGGVVECDISNPVRGCVRASKQGTGLFDNEGDVQIRKLVRPTEVSGVYDVHVLLRGKRISQPTDDSNVCTVILFDRSGSMGVKSGSVYLKGEKWYSAISGAVEFSNSLINGNVNSKIGLVLFAATASPARSLEHLALDESSFGSPSGDTNIHDGLIKAGNMFDGVEGCDSKYVILMSDGEANRYGESGTSSTTLGPSKAKEMATELKNQGIVIYSVGYDVKASAKDTLKAIAQDDDHYYAATTTNIYDVFQNIRNVVELNAGIPSDIDDAVGEFMVQSGNIVIPAGTQIIDPGTVYSFQIRIKPEMSGRQDSNSGLTLTYEDANKNPQTLRIAPEDTAQIYWTAPKCEGTYPTGIAVVTGSDEFTQVWSGDVLEPETKEWTYVDSDTPGECEWTCSEEGYKGNTGSNTCILEVIVNFDLNGGTGDVTPVVLESGMSIDIDDVPDPTKTGYHLTGWTLSGEDFVFPGVVTGNIKLKAQWEPNNYDIIYNGNDSTSGNMENQTLTYDVSGTLLSNGFERDGYHFTGWNTKDDRSGSGYANEAEVKNLTTTGTVTLYAQRDPNSYTVVFSGNGGDGTMTGQILIYDKPEKLNSNLYVKEGSNFVGWNTKPDGSGSGYDDEETVENLATSGTVTLYAQWSLNAYQIKYNGNGATTGSMVNQSLSYGSTGNLSPNKYEKNGYHFTGWNTKEDGTGTGYIDEAEVKDLVTTGIIDLYAQWEPNEYTIVFSGNEATNGTMANQTMTYDETGTLSTNEFDKIGYVFTGWNTKADGTGTGYANGAKVLNLSTGGEVLLYAQRQPNNYEIKFNANGGNGTMGNQTLTYGTPEKLDSNLFEREGFTFVGWNTKENGSGTGYADQEQVSDLATSGVVNLYAQWSTNTYQIEFNKNGGSGNMTNQTLSYGNTGTLKENEYTKEGYHFVKWTRNLDGSGTGYENRAEVKNLAATGVVKLYAQWELDTYTIIFDGNGSTAGTMTGMDMSFDQEKNLTKNNYSKNGHRFLGWNTQADGKGTNYDDGQAVKNLATSGEVRLYARWEKIGSSGGGGGGGGCVKDNCPNGDYSGDPCDKKCGTPPKSETEEKDPKPNPTPTPSPVPTPIISTKKCSIEGSKHSKEVNEAYIWACQKGIIKSNTIQGARLGEFLNRAEMAKITTIFEVWELDARPNVNKDCSAFADSMAGYSQEMKNYMVTSCQLERMGIHTADHKAIPDFMPRKFVSRAEFGTILSRILWEDRYEAEKNSRYYYVDHLNKLKEVGILTNIDPTLVERRSYAILMIYRAAKLLGKI